MLSNHASSTVYSGSQSRPGFVSFQPPDTPLRTVGAECLSSLGDPATWCVIDPFCAFLFVSCPGPLLLQRARWGNFHFTRAGCLFAAPSAVMPAISMVPLPRLYHPSDIVDQLVRLHRVQLGSQKVGSTPQTPARPPNVAGRHGDNWCAESKAPLTLVRSPAGSNFAYATIRPGWLPLKGRCRLRCIPAPRECPTY